MRNRNKESQRGCEIAKFLRGRINICITNVLLLYVSSYLRQILKYEYRRNEK